MKNAIDLSLPPGKTVRGYTLQKMPLGAFLKAARLLKDMPELLARALFPAQKDADVLERLRRLDRNGLQRLLPQALTVLPEQAVTLFAQLSGIPENQLLEDPKLGLDGLCELAEAWWEVNGLENFTTAVSALLAKARGLTTNTGSNG